MANPTASASLDKASYAVGELMTLTVNHTDSDRQTLSLAGTVTDSQGNSASWSCDAKIDAGVVTITASGGKTWSLVSASDNQSKFTATA